MAGLEICQVYKKYQEQNVLQGISFQLGEGEILALLGPSGSGKTTLLDIIAGLQEPDAGDCLWNGKSLLGIPPHLRSFGLMFQEYVLFPHLDVEENIAFGLRMADWSPPDTRKRVKEVLELVGLGGFENRDVSTLSGGEQQRIALARSLAPRPRLVMLDEPLGALDRAIRERLAGELRRILKQAQQTALYVTHDQEEAFSIADRVVIIQDGRAAQIGTPQEIYFHPASPYVASFLGMDNLLEGKAVRTEQGTILKTRLGEWRIPVDQQGEGLVLIRPDRIHICSGGSDSQIELQGKVLSSTFTGSTLQVELLVDQIPIKISLPDPDRDAPQVGSKLSLCFDPGESLQFYPDPNQD